MASNWLASCCCLCTRWWSSGRPINIGRSAAAISSVLWNGPYHCRPFKLDNKNNKRERKQQAPNRENGSILHFSPTNVKRRRSGTGKWPLNEFQTNIGGKKDKFLLSSNSSYIREGSSNNKRSTYCSDRFGCSACAGRVSLLHKRSNEALAGCSMSRPVQYRLSLYLTGYVHSL